MNKVFKARLVAGLALTIALYGGIGALDRYVTQYGIIQLSQNEVRDSNSTSRWFVGSRNIFNGSIAHGDSATVASITLPTTTTGSSFAHQLPCYNPTASTISAGTLLISSNTGAGYVGPATATTDLTSIIGVAAADIAATTKGWMVPRGGGYAVMLASGTLAVGDTLVSTTAAAGYGFADTTPTTGADVATVAYDPTGGTAGRSVLVIMR